MKICIFDTESDGFLEDATRLWCAVVKEYGDEGKPCIFTPDNIDGLPIYLDQYDVLVGHNIIQHDLPLIKKLRGWEPRPEQTIVDTLVMSRFQNPDRKYPPHCADRTCGPHSVKAWGYRVGQQKVDHDEWDRYSLEMLHRCEEDTLINEKIFDALIEEGEGKGFGPANRLNMKLFYWLQKQEEAGFLVDQEFMNKCINQLTQWMDRIDRAIKPRLPIVVDIQEGRVAGEYGYIKKPFKKDGSYSAVTERFLTKYSDDPSVGYIEEPRLVGGPFSRITFRYTDLESNVEVKDFLLKSGWIPAQWNVNNDGKRTSPKLSKDDPFEGIQGSVGRLVAKRVQCRQRRGVIEGWLENIRNDGRLSAQIAGLAITGRARHRQIVNVPGPSAFYGKNMRKIFVAEKGKVLVGIDSVGNQIRQLAARMGDEEYIKLVIDPANDMHQIHADRAGIPVRHHAKTFFYSLIFGAGDPKISSRLKISLQKAKELRKLFLNGLPALKGLLDRLEAEWEKNGGWIKGLDGRPIPVASKHQLLVYLVQSDEAIQMALAYVLFHEWASKQYKYGEEWKTVLWMHDEFQVECIPEIAEWIGHIASYSIREAGRMLGIKCPHDGDYKIGRTWYDTH
jgi:hypothetical protein